MENNEAVEAAIDLLPCAFCGARASLRSGNDEYCDNRRMIYIGCLGCKTTSYKQSWHEDDIGAGNQEAIIRWNTRHNAGAVDVEALKIGPKTPINFDSPTKRGYDKGWNDCIDKLARRGMLKPAGGIDAA